MPETSFLQGRTAIVTGAGSGIGSAIATTLAKEGAHLLVQDLNLTAVQDVAATISRNGGSATAIGGDVSNLDDVRAVTNALLESHGRVDILVNNAGLQHVAPIDDYPLDRWKKLLDVLLTGPFLFTQTVLPSMRQQKWGRIINLSSINGKRGDRGKAAYCSAKHGVIGLTRTVALETAADGITVNAICPGYVDTPLLQRQLVSLAEINGIAEEDVLSQLILPNIPQRRLMDTSEIAALVLFLVSEGAKGITGQAIDISAGVQMQ